MRHYQLNSNTAIARLLAMFIITDGNVNPLEIKGLDDFSVYQALNINRQEFAQVLQEYCEDLLEETKTQNSSIDLLDKERIDSLLCEITERNKQIITCVFALDLCKSDGSINQQEMSLLRYMMNFWNISMKNLEEEFINK